MKKIRLFVAALCVMMCMLATTSYVTHSMPVLAASSSSSATKINVSKLKIKLSATTYTYNGKERKPTVTVTYKGKKVSSDYYTVKYSSGRKLPGTYNVAVTFKGKYTGKKTLTYKIVLQSPSVKPEYSTKSVDLSWAKTSKATCYIVYNSSKKQLGKTKGTEFTVKNLKPGTKYTFYVRAYAKIGEKSYYSSYVKVETATRPAISGTSTLYVGASKTFKATASSKAKITWSSSDKKIATVSSSGKVTAVKAGNVTIKAKANGVYAYYKLTVKAPTIKISKTSLKLDVGASATLKATVAPSDMTVKWTSSDSEIAKVSSGGKVTAVTPGTATITATGTYAGKSYKKTCKVTVEPKVYALGETLTVPGKYSITFKSVEPHYFCNSYDDDAVNYEECLMITYDFKNLSSTDDLYVSDFSFDYYDVEGDVAKIHPCTHANDSNTCRPGMKCTGAQSAVMFKNVGNYIYIYTDIIYDDPGYMFELKVDRNVSEPEEPSYDESGFDILKNHISEYGSVNNNGKSFIKSTATSENYDYQFGIVYDDSADEINFIAINSHKYDDGLDIIVEFTIDASSTSTSVTGVLIHYQYGSESGSGTAKATLNMGKYTGNTDLAFKWQPGTTAYIKNTDAGMFNTALQFAFAEWENLIYSECGLFMSDIGFTSY